MRPRPCNGGIGPVVYQLDTPRFILNMAVRFQLGYEAKLKQRIHLCVHVHASVAFVNELSSILV